MASFIFQDSAVISAPIRDDSGVEKRNSRLCLLGKRFVHADWLECRIHPFAKHIHDIDSGGRVVALVVAALTCSVIA